MCDIPDNIKQYRKRTYANYFTKYYSDYYILNLSLQYHILQVYHFEEIGLG